jgi:hypothetical protein
MKKYQALLYLKGMDPYQAFRVLRSLHASNACYEIFAGE